MLPEILIKRIEALIQGNREHVLERLSKELSQRYRSGSPPKTFMENEGHRLAYLLTRMPATYAAIAHVLEKTCETIESFLDLGAGPGTGLWAIKEHFPQIKKITCFEKDKSLIALGKRLAEGISANWVTGDLEGAPNFEPHDLVLLSYALGELKEQESLLNKAWEATKKLLILIEPGTPLGFSRIRRMRELLITAGGNLIAPCPHKESCPMKEGNWCHFTARLSRTSLHRKLKGGQLGYEDEKFSYIVFSKTNYIPSGSGRILRHPKKQSGFVELQLCTQEGLQRTTFSKKDSQNYRLARKLEWGDLI
jgi:ribosomal protein RSM22 (predicted rRNA methylase)